MVCLDFMSYEMMTIASGLLGVRQQAAQVVLGNMNELSYMVAMGIQTAGATLQGNRIGKGDLLNSNRMFWVIMICGFVVVTVDSLILFYYFDDLLDVMTNNQVVLDTAKPIFIYFIANSYFEQIRGYQRGVIKAINYQERTLWACWIF